MGKRTRSKARQGSNDASGDKEDGNRASVKSVKKGTVMDVAGSEEAENEGQLPDGPAVATTAQEGVQPEEIRETSTTPNTTNPLLKAQNDFLNTAVTPEERDNFFSDVHVTPDRRAEIWSLQADLGEELVNRYSWATPDDRALRIIKHFAPIVEVGCGSNAYWCRLMNQSGIDVIGYDKSPEHGGQIHQDQTKSSKKGKQGKDSFVVHRGGPEVLAQCTDRTLFLCYPDEDVNDNNEGDDDAAASLGEACLQHYNGDYIIHVGELFLDPTFSSEQAPWGRSSSPAFQERLAAQFHCILHVSLPNWLHTADRLTVWKRSPTTVIAYADDPSGPDAENDDMEEVLYRHIPKDERLPVDVAAPCVAHLLNVVVFDEKPLGPTNPSPIPIKTEKKAKKHAKSSPPKPPKRKPSKSQTSLSPSAKEESYACPW
jgi:hypothetical protein